MASSEAQPAPKHTFLQQYHATPAMEHVWVGGTQFLPQNKKKQNPGAAVPTCLKTLAKHPSGTDRKKLSPEGWLPSNCVWQGFPNILAKQLVLQCQQQDKTDRWLDLKCQLLHSQHIKDFGTYTGVTTPLTLMQHCFRTCSTRM